MTADVTTLLVRGLNGEEPATRSSAMQSATVASCGCDGVLDRFSQESF